MDRRLSEYSLLFSQREAHELGIWGLACGRLNGGKTGVSLVDHENSGLSGRSASTEVVVTGGVDGLIKIWSFQDDELRLDRTLKGHNLSVISVALNKEGTLIASSAMDATLRLWDSVTGESVGCMDLSPMDACNVDFTQDNQFVITGSHHGKIRMYNVETKNQERQLNTRGKYSYTVAVSPDGKYIASADLDGFIYIFEYATGKMLHNVEGHAKAIRSIVFSPDSKLLLSTSDDKFMKFVDVLEGNIVAQIPGHSSTVLNAAFSTDGRLYASTSADKSVKIWDFSSHRCLHTFFDHREAIWGVKFNSCCNRVLSVSEDETLNMYGIPTYL